VQSTAPEVVELQERPVTSTPVTSVGTVHVLARERKHVQSTPQLSHTAVLRVTVTHIAHCDASQGAQPLSVYGPEAVQATAAAVPSQ
jgi:hypothetical protein